MTTPKIHLTINGREIAAPEGQTILEVCKAHDVTVPTLCHYKDLTDIGACRLCIVEIDGQRRPAPSCTTPAEDGMVIRTESPQLHNLRLQTLELIFGERNHICPFCPRSGNCELQNQAYRHGMDHVRYDYLFPQLPVDNSHPFITLDHNRCILCTRCIRACDEWVGAHVLDLDNRGHLAGLIADHGVPLGESSCVSCGTCVSVCPTGALFEKRSAHWQGRLPLELTETVCPGCGVGCRINASVRHRQIGEITSAGGPAGNQLLCQKGRFGLVNPQTKRLTSIRLKRGKEWVEKPLRDLLTEISRRLGSPSVKADPNRVVAFMSPRLPLETLTACHSFITDVVKSPRWTIVDRANPEAVREAFRTSGTLPPLAGLEELADSDMFLLVGCNLEHSHGVVASYVRRAVLHHRAKLVKLNPVNTWVTRWTDLPIRVERGQDDVVLAAILKYLIEDGVVTSKVPVELKHKLAKMEDDDVRVATGIDPAELKQAARYYAEAKKPMILCGRGVTRGGPEALSGALNLAKATGRKTPSGRWRMIKLAMGANSNGARLLGSTNFDIETFDPQTAEIAFVVLGDDEPTWPREWLQKLRAVSYVVAMVAREHEVLDVAQAVVPTATWAERRGTYVNFEGRVQKGRALMSPLTPVEACVDERNFFTILTKTWRGLDYPWNPPELPAGLMHVAHDHMAPTQAPDSEIDWSGLTKLTTT